MCRTGQGVKTAERAAHGASGVGTRVALSTLLLQKQVGTVASFCLLDSGVQDTTQEKVHQYVRDNTARAWKAVEAIERGDAQGLGRVMAAAQVCARVGVRVVGCGGGVTSLRGRGGAFRASAPFAV